MGAHTLTLTHIHIHMHTQKVKYSITNNDTVGKTIRVEEMVSSLLNVPFINQVSLSEHEASVPRKVLGNKYNTDQGLISLAK